MSVFSAIGNTGSDNIHRVIPDEKLSAHALLSRCSRKRKLKGSSANEKKCSKFRTLGDRGHGRSKGQAVGCRGGHSPHSVSGSRGADLVTVEAVSDVEGSFESPALSVGGYTEASTEDTTRPPRSADRLAGGSHFYPPAALQDPFPSYHFLRQAAIEAQPDPQYLELMTSCKRVTALTRSKVLQWLVYVQRKIPEPLSSFGIHVAVNIFDRFLSAIANHADDKARLKVACSLEIVAAACLLIASKQEDCWAIDARDLCGLNAQAFSKTEIFEWERRVIKSLDFRLNCPTALDFVNFFLDCARESGEWDDSRLLEGNLCWRPLMTEGKGRTAYEACGIYLIEVCLMHPQSLTLSAHLLAAAALTVTKAIVDGSPRNSEVLPRSLRNKFIGEEQELNDAIVVVGCIYEEQSAFCGVGGTGQGNKGIEEDEGGSRPPVWTTISLAEEVNAKHMDACHFLCHAYELWRTRFHRTTESVGGSVPGRRRRRVSTGMLKPRKSLCNDARRKSGGPLKNRETSPGADVTEGEVRTKESSSRTLKKTPCAQTKRSRSLSGSSSSGASSHGEESVDLSDSLWTLKTVNEVVTEKHQNPRLSKSSIVTAPSSGDRQESSDRSSSADED